MNWYFLGILAAFFIAMSTIIFKYKLNPEKTETMMCACLLIIVLGVFGFLYLFIYIGANNANKLSLNEIKYVILSGFLLFAGFVLFYNALKDVKHPVFLETIFAGSKIIFMAIIAYLFFGSNLSFSDIIAIILIIVGIKMLT